MRVLHDMQRHRIFLLSLVLGVVVALALVSMKIEERVLIGADISFASFLLATLFLRGHFTTAHLREGGADEDEGIPLIVLMALAVVVVSVGAIFYGINSGHGMNGLRTVFALLSVPLGWMVIHLLMAFHYARLWYAPNRAGKDSHGLDFPGDAPELHLTSFIYFSYTIGMTYQTSDVAISTESLRRTVVWHAAFSFFYNTVIMALAVNAVVSLGQ